MDSIIANPTQIADTLPGRKAAYMAGNASPAVWYWTAKRGDKAAARRAGLSARDSRHLSGWRSGSYGLEAVCMVGDGYWYTVPCRSGD